MYLDYKQIGTNLARRRKELHLKQAEVCERAEINNKYLSCIETAKSIPSLEVFLRLCEALETTPDHILVGASQQFNPTDMEDAMLAKLQKLSKSDQQLCLDFIEMLSARYKVGQ